MLPRHVVYLLRFKGVPTSAVYMQPEMAFLKGHITKAGVFVISPLPKIYGSDHVLLPCQGTNGVWRWYAWEYNVPDTFLGFIHLLI